MWLRLRSLSQLSQALFTLPASHSDMYISQSFSHQTLKILANCLNRITYSLHAYEEIEMTN